MNETLHPTIVEPESLDLVQISADDLDEILDPDELSIVRTVVVRPHERENIASIDAATAQRATDRRLLIIRDQVADDDIYQIAVTLLRGTGTDSSRLRYAQDLRIYFGWLQEKSLEPRTVTRDDLICYQDDVKRFKVSTQMRLMTVLRLLYRELEVRGMLPAANPTLMLPKIRGKADEQPAGYSAKEAKALLAEIEDVMRQGNEDEAHRYLAARDYAIVYLALTSGLRASEIVGLTCGDIHMEQSVYWVVQVRGKGRKDRIVKLSGRTVKVINTYKTVMAEGLGLTLGDEDPLFIRIGPRADPLYAESMTTRNLGKIVTKWTAAANLGGKRKSVHQLRRTAATIAYENDAPIDQIGDMLGHADLRTTRDLYIKPVDRLRRSATDHIDLG